ncbi:DUF805 domain-containing protein [Sphingomonas sp. R647]|uniref:DUF805 domain-containing protein n=1 Tax=Sphingomonas sp. R647 TaxID=2875233 RepID=UPI001CD2A196|nr:DUF805 domain-containing protein [Sphingomonas sp. R647]MCA1197073.1 DUF805 domain-containing protein [Sphingomonas sp. R647]
MIMLAGKAIRGTLDFRGRSTRLEVMAFWLALMFVGVPLTLVLASLGDGSRLAATILGYALGLPFAALFVRRLHDLDRSGWGSLAVVPVLLVNGYQSVRASLDAAPSTLPWWGSLTMLALMAIVFMFVIAPGTEGPNRFGPDPRSSIDPKQLRARDQQDEAEGAQDPLLR